MSKQTYVAVQQPKKTFRRRVAQSLSVVAGGSAVSAFALPSAESITQPIQEATGLVDATGGAIIAVAVGMLAFGLIIGMIMRKGR